MKRPTEDEVMTRDVISVPASAGYKEIVERLANHVVSAVPVVDGEGRVVSVVSEADLLYKTEYADRTQPTPGSGNASASGPPVPRPLRTSQPT